MVNELNIRNNVKTNTRLICKYMRGLDIELVDLPGNCTGFNMEALAKHNLCEKMIYLDKRNKKLIINDVTYTIMDERTRSKIFESVSLQEVETKMKKLTSDCYSEFIEVVKNKQSLSSSKMVYPYNRIDNVIHYEVDINSNNITVSEYIIYIEGEVKIEKYSTKFDSHSDAITFFGRESHTEKISTRIPDVYKCGYKMLSSLLDKMI